MKGILLIAVGHPLYGKQAYNLAVSLKAADPSIEIALVHDDTSLKRMHPKCFDVFSYLIHQPAKVIGSPMERAMELRLIMPKLTPFEVTLALDVDMIWAGKPINYLFDLVTDESPMTFVNEGYFDLDEGKNDTTDKYIPWAFPDDIKAAYDLTGKLYQMRAEFVIFKSCKVVTDVFREANKIRRKPAIEPNKLAGAITEEFGLNIAMHKAGIVPHESKWQPTLWPLVNGGICPEVKDIRQSYYALSVGGNYSTQSIRSAYEKLLGAACAKTGLKNFFPKLEDKRSLIAERKTR